VGTGEKLRGLVCGVSGHESLVYCSQIFVILLGHGLANVRDLLSHLQDEVTGLVVNTLIFGIVSYFFILSLTICSMFIIAVEDISPAITIFDFANASQATLD
jgi:hypothetical protein